MDEERGWSRVFIVKKTHNRIRTGSEVQSAALDRVRDLVDAGDTATALREAVHGRLNILISDDISSGKTTFLDALIREIPTEERLILIEDTPEIRLAHENAMGLIAARSTQHAARSTQHVGRGGGDGQRSGVGFAADAA